ncbi:FCD domain-containing protein [Burkholderia glumae]|uniref:FCD domain-containing protein n=2 Tax=Burkholderia glumae TaxID=337 RepID=UPI00038076E1|nr:FCD domain-containing protein [Burkholderia glumae]PJO21584.1 GntR family transcriptional regulator [Burkholderia glumae AU6208]QHE12214.1 FCD domain-containing protein [Burkholderia glumae AU6208]
MEKSLASSLAEKIEMLIDSRHLKPGDRVPAERDLAADLGVSRSSLREAIHQLISRGRLVSRHGQGTFVAAPDAAKPLRAALLPIAPLARSETGYWADVMEIRRSLEGEAAFFAALRANADDKMLLTAAYRAAANAPSGDPVIHAKADAAFHMSIARASHNVVLHQVMSGLLGLLEVSISESLRKLYGLPGIIELLDGQHQQIFESILGGRVDEARRAAAAHLSYVESRLRLIDDISARERRASRAFRHISKEQGERA